MIFHLIAQATQPALSPWATDAITVIGGITALLVAAKLAADSVTKAADALGTAVAKALETLSGFSKLKGEVAAIQESLTRMNNRQNTSDSNLSQVALAATPAAPPATPTQPGGTWSPNSP